MAGEIEITLDYETRSEANLKKVGAVKYAKHPSTEIMCMSYKIGDGETKLWLPGKMPFPEILRKAARDKRYKFVAHNALFEQAITKYCLPKYLVKAR